MNATDVKDALRRRHPATVEYGNDAWSPGPWTTIEEWYGIDFLAFSAWSKPPPARARYSRVGYEVKVSRADYRREVLHPAKRSAAVGFCHEFYFAVPDGLLQAHEIAFVEPDWMHGIDSYEEFSRGLCTARCHRQRGERLSGREKQVATTEEDDEGYGRSPMKWVWEVCPTCKGAGYMEKSRVEREAPTLWVPADVGLLTVSPRGCRVVKPAPLREPRGISGDQLLSDLVRWVSVRPDPRHREKMVG